MAVPVKRFTPAFRNGGRTVPVPQNMDMEKFISGIPLERWKGMPKATLHHALGKYWEHVSPEAKDWAQEVFPKMYPPIERKARQYAMEPSARPRVGDTVAGAGEWLTQGIKQGRDLTRGLSDKVYRWMVGRYGKTATHSMLGIGQGVAWGSWPVMGGKGYIPSWAAVLAQLPLAEGAHQLGLIGSKKPQAQQMKRRYHRTSWNDIDDAYENRTGGQFPGAISPLGHLVLLDYDPETLEGHDDYFEKHHGMSEIDAVRNGWITFRRLPSDQHGNPWIDRKSVV